MIPKSIKQNNANPQKPQTIENVLAPPTPRWKQDEIYLHSVLQEVQKLPSLTQALLLA